jgi:hypothetical protein
MTRSRWRRYAGRRCVASSVDVCARLLEDAASVDGGVTLLATPPAG